MATYDPTTDAGKVRLLISDTNVDSDKFIFEDDEIDAFLLMEPNVYKAAALALRTIAANEVQVLKVLTILDLKTDGRAVAQALRELAAEFEERATVAGLGVFGIAELAIPPFGSKQRLRNELLRGGL